MKKSIGKIGLALCLGVTAQAQTLSFTSGVVTNYNNVNLTLQGPTNQTCQIERLNRTNQTWDVMGTVKLSSVGNGSFSTTLHEGIYGFYRTKTTNGTYLSTNAFGAVAGYLAPGYSLIGNPFDATDITNICTQPVDGLTVNKWNNATTNYDQAYYAGGIGWMTTVNVGTDEGILVQNPSTNTLRYLVSGLFTTNALTKSIPTGYSIICSPLYKITVTNSYIVDTFDTNHLGGLSQVPVRSTGFAKECTVSQIIDTVPNYHNFDLTNSVWKYSGTNTAISFKLSEGFWVNKPTNATWTVSRPIW